MLGNKELKEHIKITQKTVECPVKGCREMVERQQKTFSQKDKFKCPKHDIYISPSTWAYTSELCNLIWRDGVDLSLLERIKKVKRESRRMRRDRSEDAVTWNVFRFLERNNLINTILGKVIGITIKEPEVIYWSYSQSQNGSWDMLTKARNEFELEPRKGSEPDIIITGKDVLIFIEAKFTASNSKRPSNPKVENKYITGGQGWWNKVFSSEFKTVTVDEEKYQLVRFWLLGTWIAKQMGVDFYLVNLVLSKQKAKIEKNLEGYKRHINETPKRKFLLATWEDIYQHISNSDFTRDRDVMIEYFKNKTLGYREGKLQAAFSIDKG